jgi:hypothetical protein
LLAELLPLDIRPVMQYYYLWVMSSYCCVTMVTVNNKICILVI